MSEEWFIPGLEPNCFSHSVSSVGIFKFPTNKKDIQRRPETKIFSALLSQGAVKGTRRHLFERPQLVCIGGKLGMVHSAIGAMLQQDIGARKCIA